MTVCLPAARVSRDRSILQVLNRNTGAWSCVCHDHFNLALAKAACEQMGYSRWGAAIAAASPSLPSLWCTNRFSWALLCFPSPALMGSAHASTAPCSVTPAPSPPCPAPKAWQAPGELQQGWCVVLSGGAAHRCRQGWGPQLQRGAEPQLCLDPGQPGGGGAW